MSDNAQPQPSNPQPAPPSPRTYDPVHGDLLAHEPAPIREAMRHPAYMDATHPEHTVLVERVYNMRLAQNAPPPTTTESELGRSEEKPRPVYEFHPDPTQPVNDVSQTVFPSE